MIILISKNWKRGGWSVWEALATLILFKVVTNVMMPKPRPDLVELEMGVVAGVSPGLFNSKILLLFV